MIKTLSINLNGQVFQINEDVYNTLSDYLQHLENFYKNTEGKQEIISDIEARFAEIFMEKVTHKGRTVIAHHDTLEVIEMMGKPEDFDTDSDTETKSNASKASTNNNPLGVQTGKRFYRDTENGVVAGVCSGLAAYFGVSDPVWIRLLFIFLFCLLFCFLISLSRFLLSCCWCILSLLFWILFLLLLLFFIFFLLLLFIFLFITFASLLFLLLLLFLSVFLYEFLSIW